MCMYPEIPKIFKNEGSIDFSFKKKFLLLCNMELKDGEL